MVGSRPEGVAVAIVGPPQSQYPRPPPLTVDAHLLRDFAPAFNLMQDVTPEGPNTFTQTSDQVRLAGWDPRWLAVAAAGSNWAS